jgi:hypothetical protein
MGSEIPMVTVIVPLYNVEPYVAQCIQSLRDQTWTDFEAICVDDGSSDASLEVARATAGDDPRFRFLKQPENRGQSAARNLALDHARGTYAVNLDADDYYVPDALERLVACVQADDLDLLFFAASTFYETRELHRTHPEMQDNRADIPGVMTGRQIYVEFERTDAFRPSACMFMVRRDLIERGGLRFEEGIIHEDLLFTMQVFPLAQRAAFLNESLYRRRMRPGSTMTTERGIKNVQGLFTVARRLEGWFEANRPDLPRDFRDAFCHRLFATWEIIARDLPDLDPLVVEEYRDGLSEEDRDAFNLHVYDFARVLDDAYKSVLGSRTYRVGHAITALPMWVRNRVKLPD